MEAHLARLTVLVAAFASLGASYRTGNFVVEAPTPEMAEQIGRAAEKYRRELAIDWLGQEMPNWPQPCPITAQVGDHLGAGGATSFVFEHGQVFGWRMTIQGSLVRILDSVLPHEVTHTVFATHFRQPLPRWADEGACTTVEHPSERNKQQAMLIDFLRSQRGIAFSRMFAMKDYPHDVMPLYSQGYSVARFLVAQGGKRKFLDYIGDGLRDENWTRSTQKFYGFGSLALLQNQWLDWVRKGSPSLDAPKPAETLVAVNTPAPTPGRPARPDANLIHRGRESRGEDPSGGDPAVASKEEPSVYQLASAAMSASEAAVRKAVGPDTWHSPRGSKAAESATPSEPGPAPEGEKAEPAGEYQVTRPQAVQRPRQIILEWSRPHPAEGVQSTGVAGS